MILNPAPSCPICGAKEGLSRCAGCKVTFYCSQEHQISDRPDHKGACKDVKKARVALEGEEATLRAAPGDFMTPAGETIFEDGAGHFWGIVETRPYMRARYALVEALLEISTYAAVDAALNHLLDMLRLCRSDNMGVRDAAPALFLRLGKDQECYDFVKWWASTGERSDYDWGDLDEPYLDLKDQNALEPPVLFARAGLSHSISVTLLKIRILFDLQALKSAAVIGQKLPQEVLDNIRYQMASNIISQRRDIIESDNLDPLIDDFQTQVSDMYNAVDKSNRYFWPALLRPGDNLIARPGAYSRGSKEEMQLKLLYSYNSWAETPGAIDYIRALAADRNW
ncbi:hypothetical protein VE02_09963 [Pseudogymnoascus sp. 03VT05]|nr:hypothetical protein VE02_09963 [Pseudogymnoascus sp. 03VT05]